MDNAESNRGKTGVADELRNPIDESPEVPNQAPEDEPATESPEDVAAAGAAEEPFASVEDAASPGETVESAPAEESRQSVEPAPGELAPEPDTPVEVVEAPAEETVDAAAEVPAEIPDVADDESPAPEEVASEPADEPKSENMEWYILKVQSNREDSIREGLQRRVKIAGLERFFGDVIVPTEKVTEVKGGRKRVMKRKLYPGYLVVQMEINDDTWFLVRETPGIGDFTGAAGRPTPMLPHEVARIVSTQEEKADAAPKLKIGFKMGDRVKINEGTFENFEGEVETIDEASGRVTVMINIFGRSTPVELEYWQVESL
jgi:transcriptional antiterminator NusG